VMTDLEYAEFFRKSFPTPQFLYPRVIRIVAEHLKLSKTDLEKLCSRLPKEEQAEIMEMLRSLEECMRQPSGPRLNVWKALRKTAFKSLFDKPTESKIASAGQLLGMLQNMGTTTPRMVQELIDDEDFTKIFLQNDEDCLAMLGEATENPFGESVKSWLKLAIDKGTVLEQKEFMDGYAKGLGYPFCGVAEFRDGKEHLTNFYIAYLVFEKEFRRLPNVKEIYDFVQFCTDYTFKSDLDAFRKLCSRLGIRGNRYGRSKL